MTAAAPHERGRRFQELDAFRGIAALWVVLFHYLYRYGEMMQGAGAAVPVLPPLSNGNLPVYWFFIISGFVITWTVERGPGLEAFAVSRFSRLYPTYWAALLLTFALGITAPLPTQHYTVPQLLWNATMLQEYAGIADIDGAYWSLAVELLFYAYMAAFLWLGWIEHLAWIALAWAIASVATHLAADLGHELWWRVQVLTLLRFAHFFVAGIAFFQIWRGRAMAVSACTLALSLLSVFLTYGIADALACAVFFALFVAAISGRIGWIVNPATLWLGAISYALYVSHELLGYRIIALLDGNGLPRPASVALAMLFALAVATLLTRAVERPAMRFIRRRAVPLATVQTALPR